LNKCSDTRPPDHQKWNATLRIAAKRILPLTRGNREKRRQKKAPANLEFAGAFALMRTATA
jgi:hypothetical protein